MHTLKLIQTFLKINLQIALAYRADMIVNILLNLMLLGLELLGLVIIFSNTESLAGWGPGQMVALLGVFRLVNTLMASMIWPATEKFNSSIRDGSMDYTLLQPANSLFLVTFSRLILWRIWDLVLAIILIVVGIEMSGSAATPVNIVIFLFLAASGALIIYSLWVILIALTFWFVKFDNNVTILQAFLDAGRFPATVYPTWLRLFVTFIVPIAVATTVPLQGLRGELDAVRLVIYLSIGILSFLLATQVWRFGIRRYASASS
jgi:ABC-2 type transport system permease protein